MEGGSEEDRRGMVVCMEVGGVRGVLPVDVWDKVDEGRGLIEAGAEVTEAQLIGRIR